MVSIPIERLVLWGGVGGEHRPYEGNEVKVSHLDPERVAGEIARGVAQVVELVEEDALLPGRCGNDAHPQGNVDHAHPLLALP
jgi:hypothetical protein